MLQREDELNIAIRYTMPQARDRITNRLRLFQDFFAVF